MSDLTLRITEIFHSLQGESTSIGLPTVFVRLTGCPLRCQYCDTAYAFSGGKKQLLHNIIEKIQSFDCHYICITGGEPLAQPNVHILMEQLCDLGLHVSIETSGAIDITHIDPRVRIVMDLKTPDSKECDKNLMSNLNAIKPLDEVKFVICSQDDYVWAKTIVQQYNLSQKCQVLFSPSFKELSARELADWIVKDKLSVRFQLQLHKILWNDSPGH